MTYRFDVSFPSRGRVVESSVFVSDSSFVLGGDGFCSAFSLESDGAVFSSAVVRGDEDLYHGGCALASEGGLLALGDSSAHSTSLFSVSGDTVDYL